MTNLPCPRLALYVHGIACAMNVTLLSTRLINSHNISSRLRLTLPTPERALKRTCRPAPIAQPTRQHRPYHSSSHALPIRLPSTQSSQRRANPRSLQTSSRRYTDRDPTTRLSDNARPKPPRSILIVKKPQDERTLIACRKIVQWVFRSRLCRLCELGAWLELEPWMIQS